MANKIMETLNSFLSSNDNKKEFMFKNGIYLEVIKVIRDDEMYLDIHSSGYDDCLKLDDALDWIKWHLLDLQSNGII